MGAACTTYSINLTRQVSVMNKQQKTTNMSIISKQTERMPNLADKLKSIKETLPENGSIRINFQPTSCELKIPSATAEVTNIRDQHLPASKEIIDVAAKPITTSSSSSYQSGTGDALLCTQPIYKSSEFINGGSDGYAMPLNRASNLNKVDQPTILLQCVANEVILHSDKAKCGQNMDFIGRSNFSNTPSPTIQAYQVMPQRLTLGDLRLLRIDNELDESITPGNLTLILGPSNVGKSYVALEIARVMMCGGSAFGLRSAGGKKVYYLDGEQDMARTRRRLCQLCGKDSQSQNQVENAFLYNKVYSNALHSLDASAVLAESLAKYGCNVVVVDNLISLFQSANSSNIIDFVQALEKKRIGVIMTLSSENLGQVFLSPTELSALSKNIFRLMPVDSAGWLGNEKIQDAISAKGPLVCITLEKTKVLPHAQDNSVVAHLPIDGQWKVLEGGFQPAEKESASHDDPLDTRQCGNGSQHALSPDENKVLGVLKRGSAKCSNIQQAIDLGESKVQSILRALIEKCLIAKEGAGKSTYYCMR